MTVAQLANTTARGSSRWLLLGSLALNLFFVGIAVAMAVRGPPPSPTWDRDVFVRMERLADNLPAADADLLRGEITANRPAIEKTQAQYRAAQATIREVLRKEPFDQDVMRAAMAETRTTRLAFDSVVQSAFAGAAMRMSPAGRQALADWPPKRNAPGKSAGDRQ